MGNSPTCFVIIGFGKKVSYINGKVRVLDLDQTYTYLIKPVFDELGIPCHRAIDKNLSGSIDKLMLQEIKNADIAIVDVSTLNANVMWELGVRHALKARHTIMICEKEQMNNAPFDINHFVIHTYAHSEEGIPFTEVERFGKILKGVVTSILNQDPLQTDSPVFTFLEKEHNPKENVMDSPRIERSFADLVQQAEQAKNNKEFKEALKLYEQIKNLVKSNMTLKYNLSFVISRQALCTYQSKAPTEEESLRKATEILEELKPDQTSDIEVLGLSGAIQKRLFEITGDEMFLDSAIEFYEKGFRIKQDYYNGINAAFMLYKKTGLQKIKGDDEWEDTKTKADYIRNAVLNISLKLENEKDFLQKDDAVWVLLTIAEAFNYKGDTEKQRKYEEKAKNLAEMKKDRFAMSSYDEQRSKIKKMELI